MKTAVVLALCAAAFTASACSDPATPPTPIPVVPTVLDTFTGTLLQFGTNSHPFAVQAIGGIKISVTSIDPSAAIGIGIGTPSTASGSCLVLTQVTSVASTGVQISGNATLTGNFCVAVSDVGNLVEPVNYTITVLHS
jgi:hypothetical protein